MSNHRTRPSLCQPYRTELATLATAWLSRVVIGGDSFQAVPLRRDPEAVALTSPSNATGVFELEAQPELLLPFAFMNAARRRSDGDARWYHQHPPG